MSIQEAVEKELLEAFDTLRKLGANNHSDSDLAAEYTTKILKVALKEAGAIRKEVPRFDAIADLIAEDRSTVVENLLDAAYPEYN